MSPIFVIHALVQNNRRGVGSGQGSSPAGSAAESHKTTNASVALTGTSAADEALLSTFIDVLSEGEHYVGTQNTAYRSKISSCLTHDSVNCKHKHFDKP